MVFTAAERRLLALLVVLLGAGYALSGLAQLGVVPREWCEGGGAAGHPAGPDDPATGAGASALAEDSASPSAPGSPGDTASPRDTAASASSGRVTRSTQRASPFHAGHLDLNAADSLDLLELPGIGPSLAGRILALRRQRGGFQSVEELRSVRGIGEKRFAKLAELVGVGRACRTQQPGAIRQ